MAKKQQSVPRPWVIKTSFHSGLVVFLIAVSTIAAIHQTTRESRRRIDTSDKTHASPNQSYTDQASNNSDTLDKTHASPNQSYTDQASNNSDTSDKTHASPNQSYTDQASDKTHASPNQSYTDQASNNSETTESLENRVLDDRETHQDHVNSLSHCDLFSGRWVYDNKSYPLYKDYQCPYMFDDLACEKYGRKDLNYQHWRWQPHGCDLPRFNATALLEKLRGKRVMFVGDSVNRNQWVSMICMVESSIPQQFKYMRAKGSLYTFKATEYNTSIDFYWAPLLVESNADDPSKHRIDDRILRIKAIEKHARNWADADILIFNSYLWWRVPKLKILDGLFESPKQVYKEIGNLSCYKMALKTWSNWLDTHVNRTKTQLFFVSMTATHHRAVEWGMAKYQNCFNETQPISKEGFWESGSDPRMMRILETSISKLQARGLGVQMLNITQLSQYRKDAHPSIYRKQWRPLTKDKLSNPLNYADCTHWCLPGVPDVFNELLYAYILHYR